MTVREKIMLIIIGFMLVYIVVQHQRTEGCRDLQVILDSNPVINDQ